MVRTVLAVVPGLPNYVMRRRGGIAVSLGPFQAGGPSKKTWNDDLKNRVASLFTENLCGNCANEKKIDVLELLVLETQ